MASITKKNYTKEKFTIWEWTALVLLALFTMISPFQFGYFSGVGLHASNQYFFERPLLYGVLMGIPAYLLAIYYMFRKSAFERRHLIAFVSFIIPLLYMASNAQAASPYLSKLSIFFSLLLYAFFILGIALSEHMKVLKSFLYVYLGTGMVIVYYSFTFLLGNRYKADALAYSDGVRLASVFTYANAYAAFLITLLLVNLYFLVKAKSRLEVLIYGFTLTPIVASLLLTLSRGAMIALPVIALITLLMLSFRKQILMIVYFTASFLLSLTIQTGLQEQGNEIYLKAQQNIASNLVVDRVAMFSNQSLRGWMSILVVSLIMMVFTYVIHRFIMPFIESLSNRVGNKRLSILYIPGATLIFMIVSVVVLKSGLLSTLLPESIQLRIDNINLQTHSVLERFAIYRDAIELWREYPILGGGGGVWEALYDRYQNYPYSSAQTHSYPIQLLVEIGIVGLVFVGALFIYIISVYVRQYFKNEESDQDDSVIFLLVALSILIHSLIDFEMSYAFFGGLVFLCLGILAGKQTNPIFGGLSVKSQQRFKRIAGLVWGIVAILLLVNISNLLYSNGKFQSSKELMEQGEPFDKLVGTLHSGLKRAPDHPFLLERLGMINLSAFEQTKDAKYSQAAGSYFDRISEVEPNARWLVNDRYSLAKELGQLDIGISILEEAIPRYPYELLYYEQAMTDRYALWQKYSEEKDNVQKLDQEKHIISLYNEVKLRVDGLKTLNKAIVYARPFKITDKMQEIVDQMGK